MTELKHCTACGQDKPRDQFGPNRRNADGLQTWCRPCRSQWAQANRDKVREYNRRSTERNRERRREQDRQANKQVRAAVFDHYGWPCACCGGTDHPGIDHIDGNGKTHRSELFRGRDHPSAPEFHRWLIKSGFPEGFQTLCRRCNTSKGTGPACRLDHSKPAKPAKPTRVAELKKRIRDLESQLAALTRQQDT